MDKLLNEYVDKFGENFPLRSMMGRDENEVIEIISKCIESNKKYEANYKDDAVY